MAATHIDDGALARVGDHDVVAEAHGVVVQVASAPVRRRIEYDAGAGRLQLAPDLRVAGVEADRGPNTNPVADSDRHLGPGREAGAHFVVGRVVLPVRQRQLALGIDHGHGVVYLPAGKFSERNYQGDADLA